jgi:hypothetical protein
MNSVWAYWSLEKMAGLYLNTKIQFMTLKVKVSERNKGRREGKREGKEGQRKEGRKQRVESPL